MPLPRSIPGREGSCRGRGSARRLGRAPRDAAAAPYRRASGAEMLCCSRTRQKKNEKRQRQRDTPVDHLKGWQGGKPRAPRGALFSSSYSNPISLCVSIQPAATTARHRLTRRHCTVCGRIRRCASRRSCATGVGAHNARRRWAARRGAAGTAPPPCAPPTRAPRRRSRHDAGPHTPALPHPCSAERRGHPRRRRRRHRPRGRGRPSGDAYPTPPPCGPRRSAPTAPPTRVSARSAAGPTRPGWS